MNNVIEISNLRKQYKNFYWMTSVFQFPAVLSAVLSGKTAQGKLLL